MTDTAPLNGSDPTSLGGYRLLGRLGEGGQGTVYLGEDGDGRRVAVKTLNGASVDDPDMRRRFVREAGAARQVASFCTAAVVAADFEAEPPYIVSEFVEGLSLKERVEAHGPLAGGDLTRLAVAVANALVAIHEAGIVHRDLKPANVLLGEGAARVIDFGIAQNTLSGETLTNSTIGTPAFMAPEQISGDPVAPATDVFAWGAVLVFAATGESPFQGPTVPVILHQVLSAEPDVSGLPEPMRGLAAAALAKDPAARPASVDVLMALLGRTERPAGKDAVTAVLRESATAVGPATAPTTVSPGGTIEPAAPIGASATAPHASAHHGRASDTPTRHAPPPHPPEPAVGAGPRRRRTPKRLWAGAATVAAVLALAVGGYVVVQAVAESKRKAEIAGAEAAFDKKAAKHTAAQVPRFSADFSGEWESVAKNGKLLGLGIEEGERTAVLADDAGGCRLVMTLVTAEAGADSLGYGLAVTEAKGDTDCETVASARMAIDADDPGTLDIRLAAEEDMGGKQTDTISMQRKPVS